MSLWHRLLEDAARRAAERQHYWVGSEHLLLALVASESVAGRALRAAGLSYESVSDAISRIPGEYHQTERATATPGVGVLRPETLEIVARAEGFALAHAEAAVGPEQVLISLLWEHGNVLALGLLEQAGVTRAQVRDQLRQGGVDLPAATLPTSNAWGPWLPIARAGLSALIDDASAQGLLYRYKVRHGELTVSVQERPPGGSHPGGRRFEPG
jgi:ATP-dependent Clp protease ATP-binding subunit ClpA